METFNFSIVAGSAVTLRFRLTAPEDVTDWTTSFRMINREETVEVQVDGTITSNTFVPNAAQVGSFDVPLTANQTAFPDNYKYAFWRTDVGFEDPLANGNIKIVKITDPY